MIYMIWGCLQVSSFKLQASSFKLQATDKALLKIRSVILPEVFDFFFFSALRSGFTGFEATSMM